MKLATLKNDTRDGRLVVVSKDLTRCCEANNIAPTLQAALDNWEDCAPKLEAPLPGCRASSGALRTLS